MNHILVLTWTIKPNNNIKWKFFTKEDLLKRSDEYYQAIKYYIKKSDFNIIIFCDNSNQYPPHKEKLLSLAKNKWKTLELLRYSDNDNYSEKLSYWAWEAAILDYTYENSKYIHSDKSWIKITWRYIITNINEIIKKLESQDVYFSKWWIRECQMMVTTWFFKISNEVYEKYIYKKRLKVFVNLNKCKKFFKTKSHIKYSQLEIVYYILLRDYLLNIYKTNHYIEAYFEYIKRSYLMKIIFHLSIILGFNDFNRLHKILELISINNEFRFLINNSK